MGRLVLKRKNRNRLLSLFYKKLANVLYGCTGKTKNDLFYPQCASAIRSLCKSVLLRKLQSVPPENIVFSQTDGALLRIGRENDPNITTKDVEAVVSASLDGIVSDLGNVTTSIRLMARVRPVDMCLLSDANRYLMLYSDGTVVSKGQDRRSHVELFSSSSGTDITELLLSKMSAYVRDDFGRDGRVAVELDRFVDFCFECLDKLNAEHGVEWSVITSIPSANKYLCPDGVHRLLVPDRRLLHRRVSTGFSGHVGHQIRVDCSPESLQTCIRQHPDAELHFHHKKVSLALGKLAICVILSGRGRESCEEHVSQTLQQIRGSRDMDRPPLSDADWDPDTEDFLEPPKVTFGNTTHDFSCAYKRDDSVNRTLAALISKNPTVSAGLFRRAENNSSDYSGWKYNILLKRVKVECFGYRLSIRSSRHICKSKHLFTENHWYGKHDNAIYRTIRD
ncbi:hypothetical protein J6590_092673 [Homalodisca vitripennis]|nr:hypothetical protein J6590_092673 [Homalodisca vitripennis]